MINEKKNYKVILLGSSGVGKTSIMNLFSKKNIAHVSPTIGSEFCLMESKKYNHRLQIWDCAGQERYRAVTRIYYRDIQGCILVFDLNNMRSLYDVIDYWVGEVEKNNTKNPIFILVGNKSDLRINTDYDLIKKLVKDYNMKYVEVSVVKNENIIEIFNFRSDYLSEDNVPQYSHNNILETKENTDYIKKIYGYC